MEYAKENQLELVAINPALVLGPSLEADYGSSLEALYLLMTGAYPILPKLGFEIVDVRDVAVLHRLALEAPEAAGKRYMCAICFLCFLLIAPTFMADLPPFKIPSSYMPIFLSNIASLFLFAFIPFFPDLSRV